MSWSEGDESEPCLSSAFLEIRPQGAPGETDGLRNTFGSLNEQVIWIQHKDSPGRSGLRVPEFARWEGWDRPTMARGYQVGQQWRQDGESLSFEKCAINYPQSPGVLSARVELVDEEVFRLDMTVHNQQGKTLEGMSCHFCWNHYRHVPLGKKVWARVGDEWIDFAGYISRGPYRHFYFDRGPGMQAGPDITLRALFTEYDREGQMFGAFIAAPQADTLMSNVNWPCTDLNVDFGTVGPGEQVTRQVYMGMGLHDRDYWLEIVKKLFLP